MKRALLSVLCLGALFVGAACGPADTGKSENVSEAGTASEFPVGSEKTSDSEKPAESGNSGTSETPLPDPSGENELPLVPVN